MSRDLFPCPFCGCEMWIESNRDWHKLLGDHVPDCLFEGEETMVTPATDDGLEYIHDVWNSRV